MNTSPTNSGLETNGPAFAGCLGEGFKAVVAKDWSAIHLDASSLMEMKGRMEEQWEEEAERWDGMG
jgi:hypothetical protein